MDKWNSNQYLMFENDILNRIKEEYPCQKNGQIIFRFPRLFFTAMADNNR